ncbi:MAG: hypothetical protein R2864_07695 [Syntrophotaleaceae bacterium]
MKTPDKTQVIALLLLLLLGLTVSGLFDRALDGAFMGRLRQRNIDYLDRSFDKSVQGFLVLSTIKAGLAVIEGSELSFGFSLGAQGSMAIQYGDVVQSLYDYVDVAWKTSLAGGAVLLLTKLLLNAVGRIDQWFLAAALASWLVAWLLEVFGPRLTVVSRACRQLFVFSGVLAAVLYLVLPLTVFTASYLSSSISAPLIAEATAGYASVEGDLSSETLVDRLSPFDGDEMADAGFWSKLNLGQRIERLKARYRETIDWLQGRTKEMAVWTIKLFAGYLFDCLVFPLAIFFVLFVATRGLLGYAFGLRRDKSFREDLTAALRFGGARRAEGQAPRSETGGDR